jgi:hypothetical protein
VTSMGKRHIDDAPKGGLGCPYEFALVTLQQPELPVRLLKAITVSNRLLIRVDDVMSLDVSHKRDSAHVVHL